MTATLAPGDAIGNYIGMLERHFACRHEVVVFADRGRREKPFLPSHAYVPTPSDVLWFHYSIYSENFACIEKKGPDYKVMDFHGVCPPDLFGDDEPEMRRLTRRAKRLLPKFRNVFDLCIVHSDYAARVLGENGYERVVKSPLAISRTLAEAPEEAFLAQRLSQIEYLLYVGRVVPQKDVLSVIELYAKVRCRRPSLKLWIVGDRSGSPDYQRKINHAVGRLGIERDVGFTGRLSDPARLKPFFKYARLLVILSHWETFCVPVVEAMTFGVPTVTGERNCVPEVIGDSGLSIDRADLDGAADRIAELLADGERYEQLRRRCSERAQLFTERQLSERLLEIERRYFPEAGKR